VKRRRDYRAHKASGKGRAQEGLRQVREERIAPPLACESPFVEDHLPCIYVPRSWQRRSWLVLPPTCDQSCRKVQGSRVNNASLGLMPQAVVILISRAGATADPGGSWGAAPARKDTDRSEQAAFLPPITGLSRSVYARGPRSTRVCPDDPGDIELTWAAAWRRGLVGSVRRGAKVGTGSVLARPRPRTWSAAGETAAPPHDTRYT
jgi:hypothetical protein